MARTFDHVLQELEEQTRRAGPAAVAHAEGLKAQYTLATDLIILRMRRVLTHRQLSARTGRFAVLSLRFRGARWGRSETVGVELAAAPPMTGSDIEASRVVETHARYRRLT